MPLSLDQWLVYAKRLCKLTTSGRIVYDYDMRIAEPFKLPNAMLPADQAADIQFTRFASWSEVASAFEPLFTRARKLEPGSGLAREADRIIAEKADPLDRMMAALQLSQEQVRYVALLLGDGAYVPTPAEENWERKFGDCKGKTALLLALLDRMGIAAVPLLVKSTEGEMLGERLPGIDVFDHVIVKARIGSQLFYLDPTDYGQRSVDEVSGSALGYGLPLVADGSLEKLPPVPIHRPLRESSLTWDATAAANGEAPFTARVILRSTAATAARVQRAVAADKEKLEELLKNQLPGISNEHIEIADWVDADEEGNFVINYKGKAPFSWDEYEGKKGYRYAIDHSGMQWEPKFDRDEGNYRDKDVYLGDPYWQRQEEILLLPSGGKGFSVDASAISETLAGTKYDRSVRIEAGRAISIGEFRHLARSISAEDARGAKDRIAEINEDYAFIVAPRSYRPGKKRD